MEIKPIRTEKDYLATLEQIEEIFDAEPGTTEGDMLEIMVTLVEVFEEKHHAIPPPDPIEAIEFHMERLGFTRKDLEPFIGNRARVSEILNRKRTLTLRMIRNLSRGLGIPPEVLTQKYSIKRDIEENPYETGAEIKEFWVSELNSLVSVFMTSSSSSSGKAVTTFLSKIHKSKVQNIYQDKANSTSHTGYFYMA